MNGQRDVYKELAWDDWCAYLDMSRMANAARGYMRVAWSERNDHNHYLQRMALWNTVLVANSCAEALEPGHGLRLWPPDVRTDVRYDLQASIRMIDSTVPFTGPERRALTDGPLQALLDAHRGSISNEHLAAYEPNLADHEPELVERWHNWLWLDELGRPQTSVRAMGASAVLAYGHERLASALNIILSDPEATPL